MLYKQTMMVFFFFLILIQPVHAEQTLVLSTPANPPYHYPDQTGTLDLLMKEAFSRIDIKVSLNQYSPEKALIKANMGETDGDAVRIGGLGSLYSNLLQVPAIAFQANFVVFTKKSKIKLNSWKDLKSYNVGIIKGHKISEKMVPQTQSLTKSLDLESLFKLLKNNKIDIAVCEQTFGLEMVKKLGMADTVITDPPLAKLLFYIYLHKKHELFVPKLIKAINEMHLDGTYNEIMNKPK